MQHILLPMRQPKETWEDDGEDDLFASDVEADLEGDEAVLEGDEAVLEGDEAVIEAESTISTLASHYYF